MIQTQRSTAPPFPLAGMAFPNVTLWPEMIVSSSIQVRSTHLTFSQQNRGKILHPEIAVCQLTSYKYNA
jgi:hypothetical protein